MTEHDRMAMRSALEAHRELMLERAAQFDPNDRVAKACLYVADRDTLHIARLETEESVEGPPQSRPSIPMQR